MAELSIAVIGCGGIGQAHLACWASLSGVRIAAVCDPDGVTAARVAASFPKSAAFTDIRALLDSEPFDIVDICLDSEQHFSVGQQTLRAGANVLCESPMGATVEEAETLAHLAAERERLLMPLFPWRFDPTVRFLRELVENDDLGHPAMFRCRLHGGFAEIRVDTASGALRNTALHGIDLFRALCGEVTAITGTQLTIQPDGEVENTVALLLTGERSVGVVEVSWNPIGAHNAIEVYGTAGAALADPEAGTVRGLTAEQPLWQTHTESGYGGLWSQIAHCADVVRGWQPPQVTAEDAVRALTLCAQITPGPENR